MKHDNRVAWYEGLFIRQHHFQQADRHMDWLIHSRVAPLTAHGWGVTEIGINRELLTMGKVGLTLCRGILPDGTPFSIPDNADNPSPLQVPTTTRNAIVHLALPLSLPTSPDIAFDKETVTLPRYRRHVADVPDRVAGGMTVPLELARPAFSLVLGTGNLADLTCLPIARVEEVQTERGVILDERFIPPSLTIAATPLLSGLLTEITGLVDQRVDMLAERATDTGSPDHLLLWALNRQRAVLHHLLRGATPHPDGLYRELLRLAGDLSTLFAADRKATIFPPYRHDDLAETFHPLMEELRRFLTADIATSVVKVPLQYYANYKIWHATFSERSLLNGPRLILGVRSDAPPDRIQREFPRATRIASATQINALVAAGSKGVDLLSHIDLPTRVGDRAGRIFFELDRQGSHWEAVRASGGLALHVAGDYPNLDLQLWACREVTS